MYKKGATNLALLLTLIGIGKCQDLTIPEPHLIIIGATGVGKSSLANVLLGQPPDCDDCTFAVCPGGDSCTKETKYAVGKWTGIEDQEFTIVDTPGFGDSDGEDNMLINEMVDTLKNVIKTANGFLLVFNGAEDRFDEGSTQMIREMEALFGNGFWDHVTLGVSHWAYDKKSVDDREHSGKDESWWIEEYNKQLQTRFGVEKDLLAVFIDSWSQQEWNLDDDLQQVAFERETIKLWDTFSVMDGFEFKTIQDIIEELRECTQLLEGSVEQLQMDMKERVVEINDLNDSTSKLDDAVKNNDDEIENISSVQEDHEKTLEQQKKAIDENAQNIDTLTNADSLHLSPIGSIVAWVPRVKQTDPIEVLPAGWIECDGRTIPEPSIWAGSTTPDLNNKRKFLRGGKDTAALGMEDDMVQDHTHQDSGHTHEDSGHYHNIHSVDYGDHAQDRQVFPGLEKHFTKSSSSEDGNYGDANGSPHYASHRDLSIASSKASLKSSTSNIGIPNSGAHGQETRPTNMAVVWIMRIF